MKAKKPRNLHEVRKELAKVYKDVSDHPHRTIHAQARSNALGKMIATVATEVVWAHFARESVSPACRRFITGERE